MENPRQQIRKVIIALTEGSPAEQENALSTYFLPDASFTHPFCRVPRFSQVSLPFIGDINSRWVIWMIYRWYKILSPRIIASVQSNAAVEVNHKIQILFVEIQQVFSIFFIPFYKSNVHLTTKLHLELNLKDGKYYVSSQEDLYQFNEFVKFVLPGGATVLWLWQLLAATFCVLGALLFAPITWLQQKNANRLLGEEKRF